MTHLMRNVSQLALKGLMMNRKGLSIRAGELINRSALQQHAVQILPNELGFGHSLFYKVMPGLQIMDSEYCPNRDLRIETEQSTVPTRLVITLGTGGQSCFQGGDGEQIFFKQRHTTITSFQSVRGARCYAAGQATQQLRLIISPEWLQQNLGDVETDSLFAQERLQLHQFQPSSISCLVLVNQLRQCVTDSRFQPLLQRGLAQSIVALELEQYWQLRGVLPSRYRDQERKVAEAVRAQLDREYRQPPTINTLAQAFGLSPFRLQKVFQHFFHLSINDYLTQLKMQHAYRLLQQPGARVAWVAQQVGYRHQGNFSQAFRRYFGVLPNQLTRS